LVLSKIDARNGAFGILPSHCDEAIITGNFWAFDIEQFRLDPHFFEFFTKTRNFLDFCIRASEGTTNRRYLQEPRFLRFSVPLPPLPEQRRIVARLEALWHKLETLKRMSASSSDETFKLLSAQEMKIWPEDALAAAPTLVDVTSYLARGRQSEQGTSEHFLIKTQHVQDRRYVRSNMTLAPHVAAKVSTEALAVPGDVLIACSAAGCLGRVAFFQEKDQEASTDTHVAIARAKADVILPEYLYAYLRGAQGQFQLRSREQGDWQREKVSFRLTELNVADMRRVPVPLPGIQEQRCIVDYLERFTSKIDILRECQKKRLEEVNALRPSLLNSAFSGQL
jgi:type I restriction enzyme S subunit